MAVERGALISTWCMSTGGPGQGQGPECSVFRLATGWVVVMMMMMMMVVVVTTTMAAYQRRMKAAPALRGRASTGERDVSELSVLSLRASRAAELPLRLVLHTPDVSCGMTQAGQRCSGCGGANM